MKKLVIGIPASLSFALVATAADVPRMETFLGYNFVRFNPDSNFVPSINANGGSAQFVYNFYKGVGIAVDAGAVNKGVLNGTDVDTTVAHLVAGPRYAYHSSSRFTPFGEVLFGGSRASTSTQLLAVPVATPLIGLPISGDAPVSARLIASRGSFAMMAGGGFDIKLSKHISFRPVAFDYYLSRPASLISGDNVNKNNWRYSAGVNFAFGGAH